jgi:flagellar motor protein MotB
MSAPRVLLVELEAFLAGEVTRRLESRGLQVSAEPAPGVVESMVALPPDIAIVNVELSAGSGFGLVNRVQRMEALAGLQIVLVAERASEDAIEMHKSGPTPAAAYVRRTDAAQTGAFADEIASAVAGLLALPEADGADVVDLDKDPLAAVILEIGGYRVLRRLRDEDGGAVFACMDEELKRPVAIKLMAPATATASAEEKERVLRFQRERRILALVQSPHVVTVYGAGTHTSAKGDTPYLVRELVDGENLAEQVKREGPLAVSVALARVKETALGLRAALSAGVIHRDVRPANIHVVEGHAKLGRFGMGRRDAPDEVRITQAAGLRVSDLAYLAPERTRGQEDARGDIYALGATLHFLLAGASPFAKPVPIDVVTGKRVDAPIPLDVARPGTPAPVVHLVARMLAEDPAQRPQDYDDVLRAIDDALRAVTNVPASVPSSAGGIGGGGDGMEPSAVHGTLRLMSVVEIAQSLELARKTATVTVQGGDEPEGTLAFDAGKLVYAFVGDLRGEDAFFALVQRKRGAFRVDYLPLAVTPNVKAALTGLILEAARRADEGRAADPTATPYAGTPAPDAGAPSVKSELSTADFMLDSRAHKTPNVDARSDDVGADSAEFTRDAIRAGLMPKPQRMVPTWLGLVLIVLVAGVGGTYAGFALPPLGGGAGRADDGADDPEGAADRELAAHLAHTRTELAKARAELAAAQPRLAELERAHATAQNATDDARKHAEEILAALALALDEDVRAQRMLVRLTDDGTEALIEIGEVTLFTQDGDEASADGRAALGRIAEAVAPLGHDVRVRVEGHTDDTAPRGGRHRNNWGLSGARADAVKKALTDKGLAIAAVSAVALADTKPLMPNKGPKGRARNRRIEVHVIPARSP